MLLSAILLIKGINYYYKQEYIRRREYKKLFFEVQRSPDILLCSSYDNTLSSCSTKHMQVHFVLQKELLQAGILKLDTLLSTLLSTLATSGYYYIHVHVYIIMNV